MVFTHLQVKETFSPLGIPGSKELRWHHVPHWRRAGQVPQAPGPAGKLEPIPDAHLDSVLPWVILSEQLISICVQLVDGLLLLLQLPVDEVLDGET